MKKLGSLILLLSIAGSGHAQSRAYNNIKYFSGIPSSSIFALEVYSESTVWFAGTNGVWGYTDDAGTSWYTDSLLADTSYPQYRSISVINDSTVFLLSAGSPAYLFKTKNKGRSWSLVYRNDHPDAFFDCLKFFDDQNGLAIGDPIDGCFQFIHTSDGGETWNHIACDVSPPAYKGEAFFAASNSSLVFKNGVLWMGSGGLKSRLILSPDSGKSFVPYHSPLKEGTPLSGIFSIDFFDDEYGAVTGGNMDNVDSTDRNLCITQDGGLSWDAIKVPNLFHGFCVQFFAKNKIILTGLTGTYLFTPSSRKFVELKNTDGSQMNFLTVRPSPKKKTLWFAGREGKIAVMQLK